MVVNSKSKTREPILRLVPRPADINYNGHIFGGWILSEMNIAGGLVAARRAGRPVATVAIEAMKFLRPVLAGDWLSVYAEIIRVGRTSISTHIEVAVRRRGEPGELTVTEGRFVYVALGDGGRPTPVDPA